MKNLSRSLLRLALVGLFVCQPASSYAAEETQQTEETTTYTPTPHTPQLFTAGISYRDFDYHEGLGLDDSEKGKMPGLVLGYRFDLPTYYISAEANIVSGHTNYDGSNQTHTIAVKSETKTQVIELEGNIGLPLMTSGPLAIFGYTGLGFHYWRRGEAKQVNGVQDYRENYSWLVFPVGIRFEGTLSENLKVSLDLAARASFGGQLDVKLEETGIGAQDANLDLGSKVGYKAELPIELKISPTIRVTATPWYEYSSIGKSNTVELKYLSGAGSGSYILEPPSRTKQTGGTVTVGISL